MQGSVPLHFICFYMRFNKLKINVSYTQFEHVLYTNLTWHVVFNLIFFSLKKIKKSTQKALGLISLLSLSLSLSHWPSISPGVFKRFPELQWTVPLSCLAGRPSLPTFSSISRAPI